MQGNRTLFRSFDPGNPLGPYCARFSGKPDRIGYGATPEEAIGRAVIDADADAECGVGPLSITHRGKLILTEALGPDVDREDATRLGKLIAASPDVFGFDIIDVDADRWPAEAPTPVRLIAFVIA